MDKNTNTHTNKSKKARIITIVLLSPIILLIVIFLWGFITRTVFDKFDQDRFIALDSQMRGLFKELETASKGSDVWKYAAVCSANKTGWMPTGDYSCLTSISTKKDVTSVEEINDLQAKYYPLIDRSSALTQKTELDPELPNDFGKKFVVSSAEKHYAEVKSGILCQYLIELNQTNEDPNNFSYGSEIEGAKGAAVISLRCEETARNHWYGLVDSTSMLIPE